MARPIWRGSLNFGLVTVPIQLYSATEDHTIHFRQIERGTGDRVRYRRVNERTGKEVEYENIVKGYEVEDGYIVVDPEELEEIAPGRSRTIDIESFVDLDDIDPIYFQKSYWLAPANEEFARAYGLLIHAMRQTNRAGIARFVMRNREYVAAIRSTQDDVLALDTLLFAEDVRSPKQALGSAAPQPTEPRGKEVDMATQLIESMSDEWDPDRFHDTYTERVKQLIADKQAGRAVTPAAEPEQPTKVVDLFEALSASVQGRGGDGSRSSGDSGRSRSSRSSRSSKGAQRSKKAQPAEEPEVDLSELRKADLDNMAREAGIRGRSKMSREELEDALRSAASERQRAS